MTNLKDFKRGDPHFCIITPTAYLEDYASQSHTHLVLAHLVDSDDSYAAFYKRMSDRGDRIICDNGAFELLKSYTPEKLIALGQKCGADAIVLPDYPFQAGSVTIKAAERWIPMFKDAGFKCAFVPQSNRNDPDDWISTYMWGSDNEDIDILCMSILGIPNALPHIPVQYARVVMTQILDERGAFCDWKFHHYLGLQSSPNVEIPSLIQMGALDSCDSSNPAWCGLNGLRYNIQQTDFMPIQKKYLREVDFDQPMTKKQHILDTVQYNIDVTIDIFDNPANYL